MRALLTALTVALCLAAAAAPAADVPADIEVDYSSLVVSKNEMICLALNDYWESRGEPLLGRIAVAQVVLNRAMDRNYPTNLCDVVRQTHSSSIACQFSWNCDGRSDHPDDEAAWRESVALAGAILNRQSAILDPTGGAKWYHSVKVKPAWAQSLRPVKEIGGHVFYRDTARADRQLRQPFSEWTERTRARLRRAAAYQQIAQN